MTLARIEGKLDLINSQMAAHAARGDDHETRIRVLESRPIGLTPKVFLSSLVGIATVVGTIAPVIALFATK